MLISKKDLLARTGISYGQLYRWKRQNLIPEEWFIKKSTFTGQETADILAGIKDSFDDLKTTALVLQVYHLEVNDCCYSIIQPEQENMYVDSRFKLKKVVRLNDISSKIKFKYKKSFDININKV